MQSSNILKTNYTLSLSWTPFTSLPDFPLSPFPFSVAPPTFGETPPTFDEAAPTFPDAPPTFPEAPLTFPEAPPTFPEAPPTLPETPPTVERVVVVVEMVVDPAPELPPAPTGPSETAAFWDTTVRDVVTLTLVFGDVCAAVIVLAMKLRAASLVVPSLFPLTPPTPPPLTPPTPPPPNREATDTLAVGDTYGRGDELFAPVRGFGSGLFSLSAIFAPGLTPPRPPNLEATPIGLELTLVFAMVFTADTLVFVRVELSFAPCHFPGFFPLALVAEEAAVLRD
jgi:hypothetical protein